MTDGATAQATVARPETGAGAAVNRPSRSCPTGTGPCLHRVVPTLLAHLAGPGRRLCRRGSPPRWPGPARSSSSCSTGSGAEQLRERSGLAPVLAVGAGAPITSVAPSTTACALTTLVTGKVPAEHGVVGYRVALDGDVMNVLQWSDRRRRRPDARAGTEVPAVSRRSPARPVPCPW